VAVGSGVELGVGSGSGVAVGSGAAGVSYADGPALQPASEKISKTAITTKMLRFMNLLLYSLPVSGTGILSQRGQVDK
jgi:hypothetical protein